MKVGDLVRWEDPGKTAVGIVKSVPHSVMSIDERVEVSWVVDQGIQISFPRIYEIRLATPRKVSESR